MHAKALADPAYQAKKAEANKATDGKLGAFCDTCHGPVAVMSGEAATGKLSPQSAQGVFCDFCHQVVGTTMPPSNTSQILKLDGTKRAQLKDAVSPVHATAYSAFHESAEFCGACHNVDHPVNGMHLESSYSEWKNGPYAKAGVVCQDCHMTPGPGVTKPNPGKAAAGGPQREHIYTMTFVGGNVGQGDAERATANLKAAAEMRLDAPEILAPGASALVTVTITNVGAGHYLPTGLTEVRQMWLDVTAAGPDGKETALGTRQFGTVLKDDKGRHPVELWEATGVHSDDRIPPQASVTQTYTITMPDQPSATIVATLNYRSLPEELAEKAEVENPTTQMATAEQVVRSSAAPVEGEKTSDSATEKWNSALPAVLAVAVLGALVIGLVAFLRSRRKKA